MPEPHDAVAQFVQKVREEFYRGREYLVSDEVERDFLEAARKAFVKHECPDCKFSIEKGHQS